MRLAEGIVVDKEKTFGQLKFSALRREIRKENVDGTVSDIIKGRTYDLKCKQQGCMIQVTLPSTIELKQFDYNAEVELINPILDTVASATFRGADVDWYIKADDIIIKKSSIPQPSAPQMTIPTNESQAAPSKQGKDSNNHGNSGSSDSKSSKNP